MNYQKISRLCHHEATKRVVANNLSRLLHKNCIFDVYNWWGHLKSINLRSDKGENQLFSLRLLYTSTKNDI